MINTVLQIVCWDMVMTMEGNYEHIITQCVYYTATNMKKGVGCG